MADSPKDAVSFTRASAERIAAAVRRVERDGRDTADAVTAPRAGGGVGGGAIVRLGRFTGSWDIGTWKTVSLCTASTHTVQVYNWSKNFWGVGTATASVLMSRACGTTSMIEIEMDNCRNIGGAINKIAGFSTASAQQILGHESGCLKWFDITSCSTATAT